MIINFFEWTREINKLLGFKFANQIFLFNNIQNLTSTMDNDELTASVWDDAVSPSNNDDFGSNGLGNSRLHNSVVAPLSNQFSSLAMDDPFANPLGFGNDDQKGFQNMPKMKMKMKKTKMIMITTNNRRTTMQSMNKPMN